ncbi:universal stress protein [Actinomycetes bacterium NPDC127524]|uniref:universal stress protein n=1 Tax=Bacillaceae TaxID=186817 RepID=UPI0008F208C0|nr:MULTISPECIES: universal stress protein [unclassified Bacillus (in: firmicutes)]OIK13469.1 universal stress protein [Bacillus sp. MUM 13]SFC88930.1 Nucleotide-binding universal stress protein, UspA family [Bacillus sp. OV322]
MYKKILVGFDGSASSSRALMHAASLAKALNSEKLSILHVTRNLPLQEPAYMDLDQLMDEENQDILKPAIQFLSESGISYETHNFEGDPSQIIRDFAAEHHYDAIVMGTTGKSIIKEALLGSISHRVAQSAECPVIIVK